MICFKWKRYFYSLWLLILGIGVVNANTELDSLKQVVVVLPNDSIKCVNLLRIADILYDGEEAIHYAELALQLAKEMNNEPLIAKAYHRAAWCYGYDEMDKKTSLLDSSIHIYSYLNDLKGLARSYSSRAVILVDYGLFEDALLAYQQALDYSIEAKDANMQATILNNWCVAYNEMGQPDKGLPKCEEALQLRLEASEVNPTKLGRVYFNLAEAAKLTGKTNQAATYYLASFRYRKRGNGLGIEENLISLVNLACEAAELGRDTSNIHQQIQDLGFPHIIAMLDSTLYFPSVSDRPTVIYTILDSRRRWQLMQGHYKQAYDLLSEMKSMDENTKLSESSLDAIADLKIKYEREQLKIKLLEEEILNRKKANQVNLLLLFLGISLLVLAVGILIYQNRQKSNRLLLSAAKQEQQIISIRSMLEGQEKERARIARDLHDGLGNMLSTVKASVGSLQHQVDDQQTGQVYAKASEMIDEACTEVRKIAHEMMPRALEKLGLRKALEDLVWKMDTNHDFEVNFDVYGEEKALDDSSNIMIYRIVQELFNNIIKYAEAKEIVFQMTYSEDWLNLTLEDDGKGFDPNNLAEGKGMGLKSIAFRTQYIGGEYEIDSRAGIGTSVSVNVPLVAVK